MDSVYIKLLEDVHKFSRDNLNSSVRQYLLKRGLANTTIDQFEVGYFPIGMRKLFSVTDPELLREYGLVYDASFGGFQNRVVFPIRDHHNNLVALSGRIFDERENELREHISRVSGRDINSISKRVKYWHNVYDKSNVLYGLNRSSYYIRKTRCAFVSEGPFDIALAHQCKINNIVATVGTALTTEQFSLLSRYAEEVVLILDPDRAGIDSMKRIKDKMMSKFSVRLSRLLLPCGYDLHDFLFRQGRKAFDDILKHRYIH